jgi:DNA polymerase I-like protein with 3'-5' exonuclease and polymerase domains
MSTIKCLFLGTFEDKSYVPYLKGMFNGLDTYVSTAPWKMLIELEMYCRGKNITAVATTNTNILSKLLALAGNTKNNPSLEDYAGSLFTHKGIEIVFLNPLKQLFTVPYGKFIAERFISKIAAANTWAEPTKFIFDIPKSSQMQEFYDYFTEAYAIAADIETFKNPVSIRCIGYTGVFISDSGDITTRSIVFPIDSEFNLSWMRKFNDLSAHKIFQNGKYDNSYLLRYNAPVRNWLWDTAHLFHSWYSELPKDLAFLNAFFLRRVVYWKDLAETSDLHEYYRYCALDTWATANVWIQQLRTMPDWARNNYTLAFPLVYPCLLAEMTGVLRDPVRLIEARAEADAAVEKEITSLQTALGAPGFNPNSPKQVVQLLKILGHADITSSGEKELQKAAYAHPLSARILEQILSIRGNRKLISQYLRTDDDAKQSGIHAGEGGAKEFNGTILYALNPHGTDTGRLASREHHFWTGLQIQNIPRGKEVKQTIVSADGFFFGECDLEQAESRDTANISGDEKLIEAVSGTKDFHSINAAAFFGKPYEIIYDDAVGKTKDKPLRDLSKRINHGATYNMGSFVLVDTMGMKHVYEAKKLLNLPMSDPIKIADYLLGRFHATYSGIKGTQTPFSPGTYYASVVEEILTTGRLTSRAFHHTKYNLSNYGGDIKAAIDRGDWTRRCFGKPDKSKPALNAYVAHCPQSLNARTLNESFMRVFYEIALCNPSTFRLHAQIHDSILFSYRRGTEALAERVRACMEIPVTIRDVHGKYRTFTVPAALKIGTLERPAKYWSETE